MSGNEVNRREFIKRSTFVAVSTAFDVSTLLPLEKAEAKEEKEQNVRVVVVTCADVIDRDKPVNLPLLRRMLNRGITELTGQKDETEAWKSFIKPTDAVVFSEAGTWLSNVPEVVLEVMKSIVQASPKSVQLAYYAHQTPEWLGKIKTGLKERGIPENVMENNIYSGSNPCPRVAEGQFTVLVMTPTLKSHTVAGVSGVVKHFATICKEGPEPHHPDAMHTAGSVIVPQFGHMRKLIIVDALRFGETEKGPSYFQKSLLFGTDPVAVDTVALDIFLMNCKSYGNLDPWLHREAADKKFHAGTSDRNKIDVRKINLTV